MKNPDSKRSRAITDLKGGQAIMYPEIRGGRAMTNPEVRKSRTIINPEAREGQAIINPEIRGVRAMTNPEIRRGLPTMDPGIRGGRIDPETRGGRAIKSVLIGDGGTGKTTLLTKFTTPGTFAKFHPEVFDSYTSRMTINGKLTSLILWTTHGGIFKVFLAPSMLPLSVKPSHRHRVNTLSVTPSHQHRVDTLGKEP